ncbi:anhydro-N-acetylmuramic acid kinase [Hypericibacter adhaerens]|nr:anhydro-N-acetylmuramic acid kinase [Hypericibacter adhaerens]
MPTDTSVLALGLMSGTSCDGVGAALIETDGQRQVRPLGALTNPYPDDFRLRLRRSLGDPMAGQAIATELTDRHAEAVQALLRKIGLAPDRVRVAGFHGQTILHAPERHYTLQVGDGGRLAQETGIDVVSDFRSRDVAEGGEGAPLAPLFHWALAAPLPRPLGVLNLGGVGNATWVGEDLKGEPNLLAFDTGPGNGLLDDWAFKTTGQHFDKNGALASAGKVDRSVLATLMTNPYFGRPAPKSLDREHFNANARAALAPLSPADGAATLVAFTVEAVARGQALFPSPVKRWIVTGGGRHNPVVMEALRARLGLPVDAVESVGWDGDHLEAQAFAYLAVRSLKGLPLSLPSTTGVPRPMPGGKLDRHP